MTTSRKAVLGVYAVITLIGTVVLGQHVGVWALAWLFGASMIFAFAETVFRHHGPYSHRLGMGLHPPAEPALDVKSLIDEVKALDLKPNSVLVIRTSTHISRRFLEEIRNGLLSSLQASDIGNVLVVVNTPGISIDVEPLTTIKEDVTVVTPAPSSPRLQAELQTIVQQCVAIHDIHQQVQMLDLSNITGCERLDELKEESSAAVNSLPQWLIDAVLYHARRIPEANQ